MTSMSTNENEFHESEQSNDADSIHRRTDCFFHHACGDVWMWQGGGGDEGL